MGANGKAKRGRRGGDEMVFAIPSGKLIEYTPEGGEPAALPAPLNGANGHAARFTIPTPAPLDAVGDGAPARDAGGKFAAGNRLGRGNPHARRQAELRRALGDAVGPDRLRRIAGKLADQAEAGDVAAAKLLLAYLLGKPGAAPDPDRLDLDEWRLLAAAPTLAAVAMAWLDAMPPSQSSDVLREAWALRPSGERVRAKISEAIGGGGGVEFAKEMLEEKKARRRRAE